jgi:hypothetical protein
VTSKKAIIGPFLRYTTSEDDIASLKQTAPAIAGIDSFFLGMNTVAMTHSARAHDSTRPSGALSACIKISGAMVPLLEQCVTSQLLSNERKGI